MKTRAGYTTGRAGAKRGPITEAFDEGIRAAILEEAPTRHGLIAEAFAEGIRAAIPAEGEEGAEGGGGGNEEPGRD